MGKIIIDETEDAARPRTGWELGISAGIEDANGTCELARKPPSTHQRGFHKLEHAQA